MRRVQAKNIIMGDIQIELISDASGLDEDTWKNETGNGFRTWKMFIFKEQIQRKE